MKKLLSLLLSVLMLFSVLAGMSFTAEAASLKAPKKVKAVYVTDYNEVLLQWKKVKNADGYIVYRSQKKNKGYKKVKTLKSKNYIRYCGKVKGKASYFKVAAYKGKKRKAYSKPVKVKSKTLQVPKNVKIYHTKNPSDNKDEVIFGFDVRKDAVCELYRSDSENGNFTKVAETDRWAPNYVGDTGIEVNKTYYYKLRARALNDVKNDFSKFSNVYSVNLSQIPCDITVGDREIMSSIYEVNYNEAKKEYSVSSESMSYAETISEPQGDALFKGMKGKCFFSCGPEEAELLEYTVGKIENLENGKKIIHLKTRYYGVQLGDGYDEYDKLHDMYPQSKGKYDFTYVKQGKGSEYVLYSYGKPVYCNNEEQPDAYIKAGSTIIVNGKTVKAEDFEKSYKGLGVVILTCNGNYITKVESNKY